MAHIFLLASLLWMVWSGCGPVAEPRGATSRANLPDTVRIGVGAAPGSVEVADFNRDHLPDLAVASETDSSVTILLGDGEGHFQPAAGSPFFAGAIPNDISIADFNRDGGPDLAVANHDRNYITVLLGNGKGGFAPAPGSPFHTRGVPHVHGVATGDFNNDGRVDLVTDSWGNNQVEVLFGDSVPLFGKKRAFFNVGRQPYQRLRAADVNGDGLADLVTTNAEGHNATVLLSNGKGGFREAGGSPFDCGDNPFGVAIGDVTGDGKPDLAIINSPSSMAQGGGRNGLTILQGDGRGGFVTMKGSPFEAGENPNRIAIGDIDGDGVADIVTSDFNGNRIFLFLMRKNGGVLKSRAIVPGRHPKGIAIADLNGDRKGDIAVCNNADNDLVIIFGR